MSAEGIEAFLARLLADREALRRFEQDRMGEAARAGLTTDECAQLAAMDLANLKLAASSAARKRQATTESATNKDTRARLVALAALAGVLVLAGVLYSRGLGRAPIYLGWDESRTALQGYALATTGRDMSGTPTPLFFHITDPLVVNNSTSTWWQPTLFYLTAAVLLVAPLAEWSVRIPNIVLALVNILLVALVARRLFGNRWYGVAAAVLLTLTPAHFFFARLAQDYFLSQTYALLWLVLLLAFLDTGARWLLVLAGATLGIGIYTHISSWIIMPFYCVVTTAVLLLTRKTLSTFVAFAVGFAIALVPLAAFLWGYPALLSDMFLNYKPVTSPNLAERITLYWDYFNPSFLFFSGGADPMWATRRVGVFLLAIAILLPMGIYSVLRRGWSPQLLLLVGFLFAPVPIVIALPEAPQYATARDLLVIPFGVLLSVAGVQRLATAGRGGRIALAVLLISLPIQFRAFTTDYFGDYQRRSSFRHDSANMGGVVDAVLSSVETASAPVIFLSDELGTGKSVQWQFHLVTRGRPELWERTKYFTIASFDRSAIPPGSLLVTAANDTRVAGLIASGQLVVVREVRDVTDTPSALILRRK